MECTVARIWLFRKLDEELSPSESELLEQHLAACDSCARQLKLLMIPRRLGRAIPVLEISYVFPASPFGLAILRRTLNNEGGLLRWLAIRLMKAKKMIS